MEKHTHSHSHSHGHHAFDADHAKMYEDMLKLNYDLTEQKTVELLDQMKIQPDWNILDVGAGTGILTPEFLKRISGGNGSLTLLEPMESFGIKLSKFVDENPGKVFLKQCTIEDGNYLCEKNSDGYDAIFIRFVQNSFFSPINKVTWNITNEQSCVVDEMKLV